MEQRPDDANAGQISPKLVRCSGPRAMRAAGDVSRLYRRRGMGRHRSLLRLLRHVAPAYQYGTMLLTLLMLF